MKKTLIALAVATSAVVSGSVFAWTPGDFNGSFEMGGQLTPPSQTGNPWSVAVGNNVTDLDATLEAGQKDVTINVTSPISILGIRPTEHKMFAGQAGITPQISYDGAVDLDTFVNGSADLTLSVKSGSQTIGTLTTKISSSGIKSWSADEGYGVEGVSSSMYASKAGVAFYGGVGKSENNIVQDTQEALDLASTLFPGVDETFVPGPDGNGAYDENTFDRNNYSYSGLYASGIKSGQSINIKLSNALSNATTWTASLPITVTYM